jgi:hypothetical protein
MFCLKQGKDNLLKYVLEEGWVNIDDISYYHIDNFV